MRDLTFSRRFVLLAQPLQRTVERDAGPFSVEQPVRRLSVPGVDRVASLGVLEVEREVQMPPAAAVLRSYSLIT
jgi:hypothetical protein